jgi:hypothetical protein
MTRTAALTVGLSLLCACATAPPPWRAISPDLRTPVEITARGQRACVKVDRRRDGCFDGVSIHAIALSQSGGHTAYPVRIGARWAVVRDGVVGQEWEGLGRPVLNANGSRLAYPALVGREWRVVVDGVAGAPFDAIMDRSITFDPIGRRLGYVARRGDSVHVVVDDSAGRGWDAVGRLAFADDGKRFAYVARVGGQMMLVVDEHPQQPHARVGDFAFAHDGESWAYTMRDSSGWYVIERASRHGPFSDVRSLAFTPPNGGLSFVGRTDGLEAVFLTGAASPRWHVAVDAPVFSGSGRRWGYVAHGEDYAEVYLDGKLRRREGHAGDLAIGADGMRYAYVASTGNTMAIVDERGRHEFDIVIDGTLQFIDGGSRWVCLAGDRQRRELYVVLDGVTTGRRLDWSEMVRLVQQPGAEDALRAWVAAAATLALEQARQAPSP